MKQALIDIGSNTVRLVIYNIVGSKYERKFDSKKYLGLLNYINNNKLSEEGFGKLKATLKNMVEQINLIGCDSTFCFATAAMRKVEDIDDVIEKLYYQTSIKINLISGEQEAFYDYLSISASVNEPSYIGCDIGGGSGQIIKVDEEKYIGGISIPIGSLEVYKRLVNDFLPTQIECQNISRYVNEYLKNINFIECKYKTLYVIGGTARAVAKLHREMMSSTTKINGYNLTVNELEDMERRIVVAKGKMALTISKVAPERLLTILPGMIVIKEIAKWIGADKVQIIKKGIREGVLIDEVLKGE